jgi:hypothetical protein
VDWGTAPVPAPVDAAAVPAAPESPVEVREPSPAAPIP